MSMHIVRAGIGALIFASAAFGATVHTYEDLAEGAYGETLSHNGVTYHDINQVSGVFPDGSTFTPDDLQHESIVEQATLFYNDFPGYGSPVNALTFGWVYIPGDNLSIGPLASAWMDLDEKRHRGELRSRVLRERAVGRHRVLRRRIPWRQRRGVRLLRHRRHR
jgi:hypothetical protein